MNTSRFLIRWIGLSMAPTNELRQLKIGEFFQADSSLNLREYWRLDTYSSCKLSTYPKHDVYF